MQMAGWVDRVTFTCENALNLLRQGNYHSRLNGARPPCLSPYITLSTMQPGQQQEEEHDIGHVLSLSGTERISHFFFDHVFQCIMQTKSVSHGALSPLSPPHNSALIDILRHAAGISLFKCSLTQGQWRTSRTRVLPRDAPFLSP